jgi:hypothetical protein
LNINISKNKCGSTPVLHINYDGYTSNTAVVDDGGYARLQVLVLVVVVIFMMLHEVSRHSTQPHLVEV